MTEILVVIPARLQSTRLPEKPLLKLGGRELVLRVLDRVRESRRVARVIVATDSERVFSVVKAAGGEAMMTPADLPTGGDRVAYVAERVPSRFVLNVQGDDPMSSGAEIDRMVAALEEDESAGLVLLAKRIENEREIARASIVKMVFDRNGRALYFSRSPIPYPRNPGAVYYKHIGPYAWRRDLLLSFATLSQTPLETTESLEMLRLLEHGHAIRCIETAVDNIEIDTPEDVAAYEEYLKHT